MKWTQKYLEGERPPRLDAAAEKLDDEQTRKELVVSLVELFERHRSEMDRALGELSAARAGGGECIERATARLRGKLQESRALCAAVEAIHDLSAQKPKTRDASTPMTHRSIPSEASVSTVCQLS